MKTVLYSTTGSISSQDLAAQLISPYVLNLQECKTWDEFKHLLSELKKDSEERTDLVIDSLDKLEYLIYGKLVKESEGAISIEHVDGGYNKGYVRSREELSKVINWLQSEMVEKRSMKLWILAGADLTEFKNPFGVSYHKYGIRANKHIASYLESVSDNIYFVAESGLFDPSQAQIGVVDVYIKPSIAYVAKNSDVRLSLYCAESKDNKIGLSQINK